MKLLKILFLIAVCSIMASSVSYAAWTYAGQVSLLPNTSSADSSVLPISLAVDSAGNIYYATFNSTGVATTIGVWKIANPISAPSFTEFDIFPAMAISRGFGYISIDKANNRLYTATEGGANATDRIHKINLADLSLDTSWGGGDGEILGSDAVAGVTRINSAIVTNTGEIIVGRLLGTTAPFTIIDTTGTVNNGVCQAWSVSGLNPRDFAFDPATNNIYATQNGRVTKWTGGTPANAALYVCTDSTDEASVSVAGHGICIDSSTDPANPIIFHSVITTATADGSLYRARFAKNLALDPQDNIGNGITPGDGTDGNISRASDMEVAIIGGTKYAVCIDYDRATAPATWKRIVFYTGTCIPVELIEFETE
jgi:hypothetical protein